MKTAPLIETFSVKGLIHCHTDLSYDSEVHLDDLCVLLQTEGFSFVALTEHSRGLTDETYGDFVRRCEELSTEKFIIIPGVEILCEERIEIAGIGVHQLPGASMAADVSANIRNQGGYAIWVHPGKHTLVSREFVDCDAIEVMNCKLDGVVAPNLSLIQTARHLRRRGQNIHAIIGLDLHSLDQPRSVWSECQLHSLNASSIVDCLRRGEYVNQLKSGSISSSGQMTPWDSFKLAVLRIAYLLWNVILAILPNSARILLLRFSRPVVNSIKGKQ